MDAETSKIKYLDAMDTSSREMSSGSENRSQRRASVAVAVEY